MSGPLASVTATAVSQPYGETHGLARALPWLLLALTLGVAALIHFYRLADLTMFLGDQGRDVTIVWQMITEHSPVLLGPTSSIGTYHRGPAYYYLLLIPLLVSRGDPVGAAAPSAVADLGSIALLFLIGRALWDDMVGLTAAILWAAAPVTVMYARFAWNSNPLPFFALLMLYSLAWVAQGREQWAAALRPAWAVAWQLHDESLLLLPILIASLLVIRPRIRLPTAAISLAIAGLVLLPYGVFEVTHGFANTLAMLWYVRQSASASSSASFAVTAASRDLQALQGMDHLLPGSAWPHRALELLGILGIVAVMLPARQAGDRASRYFGVWLALPLLYVFWPGDFDLHYLAILFPLTFLLCGLGLRLLGPVWPGLPAVGLGARSGFSP